ncbi:MAG: hypothetical protein F6K30_08925 [Cyanothece sp. SIO2G6]|nr:hypothetical protein [Cyanothece sp. SIO2G6]
MAVNLGTDNYLVEKLKAGITYKICDPRFGLVLSLFILGDRKCRDPHFCGILSHTS